MKVALSLMCALLLCTAPSFAKGAAPASAEKPQLCLENGSSCETLKIEKDTGAFFNNLQFERAIDGDTFVASGHKIRIWGIDTPEKDEAGYLAAKMLLEVLLKDGRLLCKSIEKDRYKRDVMYCTIDDLDVGSMMVQAGIAKDYTRYSGGYYRVEQAKAKKEKRGLWKEQWLIPEQKEKQ